MKARDQKEKIPIESKSYPGEFFFFVRVNELLHGLGAKFGIEMSYIDVVRPFAQRGLEEFMRNENQSMIKTANHLESGLSDSGGSSSSRDTVLAHRISETLRKLNQEGQLAGAQVCVIDPNGEEVVELVQGHMGGLKQFLPLTSDALVLGYSCTKAIAATLAHVMVAEGYLSYDEPISARVWKEFCPCADVPESLAQSLGLDPTEIDQRWAWKRQISLRHILTHSAGLWSALPTKLTIQMLASCEQCCQSDPAGTLLPTCEPGAATEYHFLSFGWLVAGSLMGAYAAKQGTDRRKVTFEDVYKNILSPRLSERTRQSGFCPFGGGGGGGMGANLGSFPLAFTHVDDRKVTELLQRHAEMDAQGVTSTPLAEGSAKIRETFRGKEFLIDHRIWNCTLGQNANCPAAGGRFTARALASFYHDLGSNGGQILDAKTFLMVAQPVGKFATSFMQGETNMTTTHDDDTAGAAHPERAMAMGYQRMTFQQQDSYAVGHAGIGGSVGFCHPASGVAVAVMLNKADASPDAAVRIIQDIADHFHW
jgi:CubicO group peptidase (beta-lactamase class C family)